MCGSYFGDITVSCLYEEMRQRNSSLTQTRRESGAGGAAASADACPLCSGLSLPIAQCGLFTYCQRIKQAIFFPHTPTIIRLPTDSSHTNRKQMKVWFYFYCHSISLFFSSTPMFNFLIVLTAKLIYIYRLDLNYSENYSFRCK